MVVNNLQCNDVKKNQHLHKITTRTIPSAQAIRDGPRSFHSYRFNHSALFFIFSMMLLSFTTMTLLVQAAREFPSPYAIGVRKIF